MANTKERKMSPKGFLAKTNTKAAGSALAFLSAHREYLLTGELASKTSEIIAKVDAGELMPTPALDAIRYATLNHIIASDSKKLEAVSEKVGSRGTSKPWRAIVYNAAGEVQTRETPDGPEDLIKTFDLGQRANEWADRRLFELESDCYAIVEHTTLAKVSSRIERSDAIARIMKQPKGPTIQQKKQSTQSLSFGSKVKETKVTFSHG